jgi:NADPH:quinone reductase-like Zn-dependent oxidoreductase
MEGIYIKAVVCTKYGPPEVLQLSEVEKPTPGKNDVCIKILATSVTASDCIIRGFKVSIKFWIPMGLVIGFKKPRKPILGMVFAGEVESVGNDVKSFKKGDQVFGFDRFRFGTYAEYKCIPEVSLLVKKATNVTYEEAVAVPFGGLLALHYLKKGNIQSGQKILIYGASGAIGTSAVQLAKYLGADVTGVCSTANLELVKSLGANKVIDYTKEDFTVSEDRYDLIFNAVGKKKIKLRCKKALTQNGKHITVDDGSPTPHIEDLILLNELMEKGQIKAVIDRCYPLEQIVEAHRYVDKGHKKGNVIITVEQNNL